MVKKDLSISRRVEVIADQRMGVVRQLPGVEPGSRKIGVEFATGESESLDESELTLLENQIVGVFHKQEWENDYANNESEEKFDATALVLFMDLSHIQTITDCDESSDFIGNLMVDWTGPHSVYLEEGVREYFNVVELSMIDEDRLLKARNLYASSIVKGESSMDDLKRFHPNVAMEIEHKALKSQRAELSNEDDSSLSL